VPNWGKLVERPVSGKENALDGAGQGREKKGQGS